MRHKIYSILRLTIAATSVLMATETQDSFQPVAYPNSWNDYRYNDVINVLKKERAPSSEFMTQWMSAMVACFPFDGKGSKYRSMHFSRTVHTLASVLKLGSMSVNNHQLSAFLNIWERQSHDYINTFNAQDIANSLWAYATLGKAAPDALLQAITKENIKTFNAQGIANSLWAYATLGKTAPDALLQAVAEGKIETFKAQEIANSLWAYATLGKTAPEPLLKAITDENIKDFNAQGIANSLWVYATLGKTAPGALLQAITKENIKTFNAQGIANSLWAYATLGKAAPDALLQAITKENIKTFKAQNIANSLWAYATLGKTAPDALLQAITNNINSFNAQDIVNSLWAYATMGKTAPDDLLQAITSKMISTFKAQGIANSLWAYATLGKTAPDALLQAITKGNINTFNAQDIANSLWAYATLGKTAPDVLLKAITKEKIKTFNAQNIVNSLWACATLGKTAPDALLQAITKGNINTFKAQQKHQIYLAFQYFDWQIPFDVDHKFYEEGDNTVSQSETKFFDMLNRADVKQSVYIKAISSIVDGYHAATQTVIQVDGPTHYDVGGNLLPSDRLLDTILEKHGYTVFRFKLGKKGFVQTDTEVKALLNHLNSDVKHQKEDRATVSVPTDDKDGSVPETESMPEVHEKTESIKTVPKAVIKNVKKKPQQDKHAWIVVLGRKNK